MQDKTILAFALILALVAGLALLVAWRRHNSRQRLHARRSRQEEETYRSRMAGQQAIAPAPERSAA